MILPATSLGLAARTIAGNIAMHMINGIAERVLK